MKRSLRNKSVSNQEYEPQNWQDSETTRQIKGFSEQTTQIYSKKESKHMQCVFSSDNICDTRARRIHEKLSASLLRLIGK